MLNENQVIQLRDSLNNEGYCQVNNIFHPQLIDYFKLSSGLLQLEDLYSDKEENNLVKSTNKRDKAQYAPFIGETLLLYLTSIYSKISGKNLTPTYSFYRNYFQGNSLNRHTDRPSCQYSATIQIDSSKDESWPIWIQSKNRQDIECNSKIGDAVFYKGEEVEHWREELQYEYSSHLFLHWVDKDDPTYKEFWLDGRKNLLQNPWKK
tara:strand:- start:234 stop:854 length:621 start_codon:yes stop_codon:yes gene_type:complete